MRSSILILLVALGTGCLFTACKKESNPELLDGSWIEQRHRSDTLIIQHHSGILLLNRPKTMTGAYLIPKIGAGMYTYKNLKDSIQLQYSLSSLYAPRNYQYSIKNGKLYIDDFYEKSSTTLIFERLK